MTACCVNWLLPGWSLLGDADVLGGLVGSLRARLETVAQRTAEGRIHVRPVLDGPLADVLALHAADGSGDRVEEARPRGVVEHLAVEGAGLTEVVVLRVERRRRADQRTVRLPRALTRALRLGRR